MERRAANVETGNETWHEPSFSAPVMRFESRCCRSFVFPVMRFEAVVLGGEVEVDRGASCSLHVTGTAGNYNPMKEATTPQSVRVGP